MNDQSGQGSRRVRTALQRRSGLLVPLAGVLAWCASVGIMESPGPGIEPLPAFHEIEQVSVKKERFFEYLTPVIRAENERILKQRERLIGIVESYRAGEGLGWSDRRFVEKLANEYRLDPEELDTGSLLDLLVARVDVIPRSLVLVQAAKESGWGSSRFARQGNNLFGQWCFEPGCGVVPRNRPAGTNHEVASFETVRDSVTSYVRNLNTHSSYRDLRELRTQLREQDRPLSGSQLAEGLDRYSERGAIYVREVQSMIQQNGLETTSGS